MFYIYRIPRTNKIGCTKDLKSRVEKYQGCSDYEILYKTEDIEEASIKEFEFQDKYKYKRDRIPYNKLKANQMKTVITPKTTTFKDVKTKEDFKNLKSTLKDIVLEDLGTVVISTKVLDFIQARLQISQYNGLGMYVNNDSLWKFYESQQEETPKKTNTIFDNIRQWAKDKGILDKGDTKTQYIKLQEESGELAKAILNNDRPEIIDAIGDCVVVLTNLAALEELKIEDCINSAYNVISKRTGEMKNGTFVKENL
jgi:NTP pyrophosphatase (non-canonical NTP hydrolase)